MTAIVDRTCFYQLLWAETGVAGLRIGALLRIGFAAVVLYDRFVMTRHLRFFFDPSDGGVIPPFTSVSSSALEEIFNDDEMPSRLPMTSIFQYFGPEWDPVLVNTLHYGSIFAAVLLLIGITPRLMALGIHISIVSFRNRSINMMYDLQDTLFLLMSFYTLFLPLHHWSITQAWSARRANDGNNKNNSANAKLASTTSSSWPIWPFRLIQWQVTCIYTGAGLCKLSYPIWREGWAMYNVIHQQDFFGGFFCPDFIFNRMGTLWILTYASLVIECTCWIFVWPTTTRRFVVLTMILFHLGIDLSMNLHIFHWLSILAWCSFFVEPEPIKTHSSIGKDAKQEQHHRRKDEGTYSKSTIISLLQTLKHIIIDTVFPLIWLFLLIVQTAPLYDLHRLASAAEGRGQHQLLQLQSTLSKMAKIQYAISDLTSGIILEPFFLHQGVWNMYSSPFRGNSRITAEISLSDSSDTHTPIESVYWVSTEWTKLSVLEKKLMYRHVLFWNSLHFEPLIQHELCRYLAQRYEKETASTVDRVVLNKVSVKAPQHRALKNRPSWGDHAIQTTLVQLVEEVLYVYEPNATNPGEGVYTEDDEDEDGNNEDDYYFGYVWDDDVDGIWWDGVFYQQYYDMRAFVLSDYQYESSDHSNEELNVVDRRSSEGEL